MTAEAAGSSPGEATSVRGRQRCRITETLVKASRLPIYWMFPGLGRSDYGVLARLDNVTGGVVDNAGLIPIDDIDRYPDSAMYGQIFGTFVKPWVEAATRAGVI